MTQNRYRYEPKGGDWVELINPATGETLPGAAQLVESASRDGDIWLADRDGKTRHWGVDWFKPVSVANLAYQRQQRGRVMSNTKNQDTVPVPLDPHLSTVRTETATGVRSGEEPVDNINHPAHYTAYKGIEVIQLAEQLSFNRGNAVKYIARAGLKSKETEIQDLEKAAWYINREIARIKEDQK